MYKGILLSLTSSVIFAGLYYYATLLNPLDGQAIFGWRMLLMAPFVMFFIIASGDFKHIRTISDRLRSQRQLLAWLPLSSFLLGSQQWLFMWAPLNKHGLDVSLGYFLLPLVMIAVGRFLYREKLSNLQKVATGCALVGVTNEIYEAGGFAWPTLVVAFGFPAYFILRKKLETANTGGLWFDVFLTSPVALYFIFMSGGGIAVFSDKSYLWLLLLLLALISAIAFICYTTASRMLPFGLFGLLGYVEPVLMVVVAMILGERIQQEEWLTYIPIWFAVGALILDGILHVSKKDEARKPLAAA